MTIQALFRQMTKGLTVLGLAALPLTASADNFRIDPNHTYPNFKISHLGFSTLHGRFGKTSGSLSMDREKGSGSVVVVIETASIDTGMKKRDDHLRSPDFFNATEFPEISFNSTKVSFHGEGATVQGNLTMKGVTKPVTLEVERIHCGTHPFNKKYVCGFDATAQLKRSDFGINYGLPAIGDEVALEIEVEAFKE